MPSATQVWYLYILRCGDGSLYSGVSPDVERRLREHSSGGPRCAKYLRGRGPLQLVYMRPFDSRGAALSAEAGVKKLSRREKESLLREAAQVPHLPASVTVGMIGSSLNKIAE
jgi:putative endonuclease